MNFSQNYINECIEICKKLNPNEIEDIAILINSVRDSKGRIFFLGVVDLVLHMRDLRIGGGLDNFLCVYQGCGILTDIHQEGNVLLT